MEAFDPAKNIIEFFHHGLVAVGNPDVGYVGSGHVVASYSVPSITWAQPMLFNLKFSKNNI